MLNHPGTRCHITCYVLLTYALSWPIGLWAYGWTDGILARYAGAWCMMMTPALAAVVVRVVHGEGFRDAGWERAPIKAYLAVLALCGALQGIPACIDVMFGTACLARTLSRPEQIVLLLSAIDLPAGFGEEFGWRGYLLPRLLRRDPARPMAAAWKVGLIWGAWHWPIVIAPLARSWCQARPSADSLLSALPGAVLACAGMLVAAGVLSVLFGALWIHTRSIVLVAFCHTYYVGARDIVSILVSAKSLVSVVVMVVLILPLFVVVAHRLKEAEWRDGREGGTYLGAASPVA